MKRRLENDEGATLIIALLITTVVALVTGALLSQSGGSVLAKVGLRQVASSAYTADAAAKMAIGNLQQGGGAAEPGAYYPSGTWVFNNDADGTGCFGKNTNASGAPRSTLNLNSVYPGTGSGTSPSSARVECTVVPGTGVFGSGEGVEVTESNSPKNALMTLGADPAEGIDTEMSGSESLFIRGSVSSKSQIRGGSLTATGSIRAVGSCSSGILVSQSNDKLCDTGGAGPTDPNYGSGLNALPPRVAVPTSCVADVRTFEPGYYDNADELTTATNGSTCAISWFKPGKYYFDFRKTTSRTWTVGGSVLGGTPSTNTGNTLNPPVSPLRNPSGTVFNCRTPLDSASTADSGVRFIFGGDSRMFLGNDSVLEICASRAAADTPPIAILGLKAGDGTPDSEDRSGLAANSVAYSGYTNLGTDPQLSNTGDSNAGATWTNVGGTNGSPNSASITLTGFNPSPSIPTDSILSSATLLVRHREPASNAGGVGVRGNITVTPVGGAAGPATNLAVPDGSYKLDQIDLTSVIAPRIAAGTYSGLQVAFNDQMKGSGTANVDYVVLNLTYAVPALHAQSGCILLTTNAVCPLVASRNPSYQGEFYVRGATYAPRSFLDLNLGNGAEAVLGYGLIARWVYLREVSSFDQTGPVVVIPELGPGFGPNVTAVDLKIYVCRGESSCASGGTLALTTRVRIADAPIPAPNARKIDILSWSTKR